MHLNGAVSLCNALCVERDPTALLHEQLVLCGHGVKLGVILDGHDVVGAVIMLDVPVEVERLLVALWRKRNVLPAVIRENPQYITLLRGAVIVFESYGLGVVVDPATLVPEVIVIVSLRLVKVELGRPRSTPRLPPWLLLLLGPGVSCAHRLSLSA